MVWGFHSGESLELGYSCVLQVDAIILEELHYSVSEYHFNLEDGGS